MAPPLRCGPAKPAAPRCWRGRAKIDARQLSASRSSTGRRMKVVQLADPCANIGSATLGRSTARPTSSVPTRQRVNVVVTTAPPCAPCQPAARSPLASASTGARTRSTRRCYMVPRCTGAPELLPAVVPQPCCEDRAGGQDHSDEQDGGAELGSGLAVTGDGAEHARQRFARHHEVDDGENRRHRRGGAQGRADCSTRKAHAPIVNQRRSGVKAQVQASKEVRQHNGRHARSLPSPSSDFRSLGSHRPGPKRRDGRRRRRRLPSPEHRRFGQDDTPSRRVLWATAPDGTFEKGLARSRRLSR